MRLRAWTATSTSVARRWSACARNPSPITCFHLPVAASARARLVYPDAFCQAMRPCSAMCRRWRSRRVGSPSGVPLGTAGGRGGPAPGPPGGGRRPHRGRLGVARGDAGVDAVSVVRTVGGERGDGPRHSVEQGTGQGAVVHLVRGQRGGGDPAGVGVHADVRLPPRPPCAGAVLLEQPLARAAQLQARAVHQQVRRLAVGTGTGAARPRPRHLQRRRPAAECRVVRHTQREAEQADDGADQALGLPVGEAEHRAQRERRQDGERRVPGLAAPGRARLRRPRRDRLVGEPHRQAAAPAQARVILPPVGDLVALPRDVMAAVLVQLERHGGHPGSGERPPSYATQLPSAPTDRSVHHALAGRIIADTREALTLREASYPAVQYIPRKDVDMALLERTEHITYCPYKGDCAYYSIPIGGERSVNAVWTYEAPYEAAAAIKDYLAFYLSRVDAITVGS